MGFDNDHLGTLMPFGAPSTPSFVDGLDNERVAVALGRARLFLALSSDDACIGLADARHPKTAAGGSSCRNIQTAR